MDGRPSALLVATSRYGDEQLKRLRAPAHDAQQLRDVLADAAIGGFTVELLTDRPSYEIREQIEGFFADRSPDEVLLLYFSCHGVTDTDGRLYFATTDTRRQRFRATAVEAAFVQDCFHSSRSRRVVLILDCCHSGAFPVGLTSKGGDTVPIKTQLEGRGRAVLTSSDALEYAFEVDGDRVEGTGIGSAFTSALVEGLRSGQADLDGDGEISIDELYEYTYNRVRELQPSQTPRAWIDVQGRLVIARSVRPPRVATLPAELQELIRNSLASARLAAVKELRTLLEQPHSDLAAAARAALVQLASDDDSRAVQQAAAAALGETTGSGTPSPGVGQGVAGATPHVATPATSTAVARTRSVIPSPRVSVVAALGFLAAAVALTQPLLYSGSGPTGYQIAGAGSGSDAAPQVFAAVAVLSILIGLLLSVATLAAASSLHLPAVERLRATASAYSLHAVLLGLALGATVCLLALPPVTDQFSAMDLAYWIAVVAVLASLVASIVLFTGDRKERTRQNLRGDDMAKGQRVERGPR